MSIVKSLKEATGKASLMEVIKTAGLSIVLDGNWGETAMQLSGNKGVRLVGEDPLGNKYYEDNTRPYGRHRWVSYKALHGYEGSMVHPQWHAWLHCISDDNPTSRPVKPLKYDVEYVGNKTHTAEPYLPKGSWKNSQQRNWQKVQLWVPGSTR